MSDKIKGTAEAWESGALGRDAEFVRVNYRGGSKMSIAETTICVEGGEIDVIIEYEYTPPVIGVFNRAPDDCYPTEPGKLELTGLRIKMSEKGESVDVSGLLGYAGMEPETLEFIGRKALIESLYYAADECRQSECLD